MIGPRHQYSIPLTGTCATAVMYSEKELTWIYRELITFSYLVFDVDTLQWNLNINKSEFFLNVKSFANVNVIVSPLAFILFNQNISAGSLDYVIEKHLVHSYIYHWIVIVFYLLFLVPRCSLKYYFEFRQCQSR